MPFSLNHENLTPTNIKCFTVRIGVVVCIKAYGYISAILTKANTYMSLRLPLWSPSPFQNAGKAKKNIAPQPEVGSLPLIVDPKI